MRTSTPWIASVVSLWLAGCSHSATQGANAPTNPSEQVRIAVAPALWITPNPSVQLDATSAALQGLRASPGVLAEDATPWMEPQPSESGTPCQEDLPCIRHLGTQLQARKVVVVKLAELGDTVLARVMLVDVQGGTQEQTRQQVLRSPSAHSIAQEVRTMTRELGRPFDPPTPAPAPHPWYTRWWVWAGVGAAASIGATTVLLLTPNSKEPSPPASSGTTPDIVVVPP